MGVSKPSIAVIGAGIIGLSCAWELSKRGAVVSLYDRGQPGHGATFAAAGMLGAGYEAACDPSAHPRLFDLCRKSADAWRGFASELESYSGQTIDYQSGETLVVEQPNQNSATLHALTERLEEFGIPYDRVKTNDIQKLEPSLSDEIAGGFLLKRDGQVDNRKTVTALLAACHKSGIKIVNNTDGSQIDQGAFDHVIWTVGADLAMEEFGITPIKGAAFSVRPGSYLPKRIIRFANNYIVPKQGRVIIGATMERDVRSQKPDVQRLATLRQSAAEICPGIETAALLETWSGLRPASIDHAPILGQLNDGRFVATGHYRNGILLAPITAKIIADMILDNRVSEMAAAFRPNRFANSKLT